jgi:deoxyribose-phosphate aldolase
VELNAFIDHTLLRPEATVVNIERICREALSYRFYAVVVNPVFVPLVSGLLKGSGVKTCTVAGFPLGANRTDIKLAEAGRAVEDGADEIDIVANLGWLSSGSFAAVADELRVIRHALPHGAVLKVIIETPVIKSDLWPGAIAAAIDAGADFVKTATGFFGPTPVDHVARLADYAAGRIKVKAAGGIRTAEQAGAMIMAGACRIGSSSSVAIVTEKDDSAEK